MTRPRSNAGPSIAPPGDLTRLLLAPPDRDSREPFRIAVFADVQERIDDVQDIYRRMNADPRIRFALMSGDLTDTGTARQLVRFQSELRTLAFPIYATLGNHELGSEGPPFHDLYGRGSFSFTYRAARFTLLDSASATLAPLVHDWLDGWLDQGRQSFHLVTMHVPPLDPVGTRNGAFASRLEAHRLVSQLAASGVDLTVYGHVHSYYAFANAGIPAYISGGGGGIPERLDGIGRHFLTVDVDPAHPAVPGRGGARGLSEALGAGVPEAAVPASGPLQLLHLDDIDARDGRDHQLGDAVARLDDDGRLVAQVHQQHHDLAAVVAVDGARRVRPR